ncbi:MAG: hypothetical protein MI924_27535, partial [Chloroflexales bacterium]|nr:hypothetical protein [Chloroflexales bacterium]
SELSQGVVVCNLEGQILLYNSQARQLLGQLPVVSLNGKEERHGNGNGNGNGNTAAFVGLGRSIFSIIDRNLIAHTLDNLYLWLEQGMSHPVSHFITTNQQGRLIRVYVAPMQDQQRAFTGYVLTFEDTTQRLESSSRRDVLLQSLIERTRASLANIRAAIETIVDYPDMNRARLNSFTDIIHNESLHLSAQLEQITADSSEYLRTKWPLEDMLGADLITIIQRKVEQRLSVTARTNGVEEHLWLKIDSFSLVQAMAYIIGQLHDHFDVREVTFGLHKFDRFIQIDMTWASAGGDTEMVRAWKQQPAITNGEGTPLTLTDVVERHEGEIWCMSEPEIGRSYVRLLLPGIQPHLRQHLPALRESRPEFYDFDLFRQAGQKPELDDCPLTDLVYTVFDTETTGLNPSEGDEIISIGAVRIVNGRLLRQEVFDQLIDPRRSLSKESIRVHGIEPDMLLGQPPIEQVLPRFSKFSEDTVLVAHNAAFDMRFLQIKEAKTGVKFSNPVLDTLLLAAVINSNQEDHSIEAVARALGVNIIGRHTALGDAMVTGEVFLKLIMLLKEQEIVTLKQAREAAQKTYYARLVY